MKEAKTVIQLFILSSAQFVIGVMIVAGKADITTIGWYYIIASVFTVLLSLLAALGLAIKNSEDK